MFLLKKLTRFALSCNDDKRMQPIDLIEMQSIDLIETYACRMNKNLVCKTEEIKCNNIIKQYKNFQFQLYYKRRHKKT